MKTANNKRIMLRYRKGAACFWLTPRRLDTEVFRFYRAHGQLPSAF